MNQVVIKSATITPVTTLGVLSQSEVEALCETTDPDVLETFRRCALAVLTSGAYVQDSLQLFERYSDFSLELVQEDRGIRLNLHNAPAIAFVDGEMILGIRQHLFSVLRDIIYVHNDIERSGRFDLASSAGLSDSVFHILRHADVLRSGEQRGTVVCWGGHAIGRLEYDFTKEVGYQFGLRRLDICTGCGPGAMKGPMKGAAIGHAKQRVRPGRYIGISEPGIITAEAPNPLVNQLVIMPDMEKRLEAFVRVAHAIVVFPGGAGTAEEVLYLLSILADPANHKLPFPLFFAGPPESEGYFHSLDAFIRRALGDEFTRYYRIVIGDPVALAAEVRRETDKILRFRDEADDAPYFNWLLRIALGLQRPFAATHEAMAALDLSRDLPPHELAANLRQVFSGIVAGNVKAEGIRRIQRHGPFDVRGDAEITAALDELLQVFVAQERMKLPGTVYEPCYRLVS